jgi:hypothetical protein
MRCPDGICRAGSGRTFVEPDVLDRHPILTKAIAWTLLVMAATFMAAFILIVLFTRVI